MSLAKTTNQKQATESRPDEKEKVCMIVGIFGSITMSFPYGVSKREFFEIVDGIIVEQNISKEEIEDYLIRIGMDFSDICKREKNSEKQVDYCRRQFNKRTSESEKQADYCRTKPMDSFEFLIMWCAMIHKLIKVGRIKDEGGNGFLFIEEPEKCTADQIADLINRIMDDRIRIVEQEREAKKAKNDKKRKAKKAKKTAGKTETETEQSMMEAEDFRRLQQEETTAMEFEDFNVHCRICRVCETPTRNLCEGCRKIYYCSTVCQRSHWKDHKKTCKA